MAHSRSHRNHGVKLGLCLVLADSIGPNPTSAVAGTPGPAPLTRPRGPPSRHAFWSHWLSSLESRMPSSFHSFIFQAPGRNVVPPKASGAFASSHFLPLPPPTAPQAHYGLRPPTPTPHWAEGSPGLGPCLVPPTSPGPGFSLPCGMVRIPDTVPGVERVLSPAPGAGDPGCPSEACPTPSQKGPPG